MRTTCTLLLFLTTFFSIAQDPKLDSLKNISYHRQDTVGVMASADLCYEYRFINQDTALLFGRRAIDLAKRIDYKKGLAQSYSDWVLFITTKKNYRMHWPAGILRWP
jgi:hypothetical protein